MKNIIGAFGTLVVLMLNTVMSIEVSNASVLTAVAKEFKADVVAQIENSNFNPNIIAGCISQAKDAGYELEITNCVYDVHNNIQSAEVVLTYSYCIPLLGIAETKTTRGIAR